MKYLFIVLNIYTSTTTTTSSYIQANKFIAKVINFVSSFIDESCLTYEFTIKYQYIDGDVGIWYLSNIMHFLLQSTCTLVYYT